MEEFTGKQAEDRRECGLLKSMNIRFFCYAMIDGEVGLVEINEQEFLDTEGEIEYERHTVRENGSSQICLTKVNI